MTRSPGTENGYCNDLLHYQPVMTRFRIGLFVLILLAALLFWFLNSEWLASDKCLDGGGRWDETLKHCQVASGEQN